MAMLTSTESVSKGCFSFQPKSFNKSSKKTILPDPLNRFKKKSWFEGYSNVWNNIKQEIDVGLFTIWQENISTCLYYFVDSLQMMWNNLRMLNCFCNKFYSYIDFELKTSQKIEDDVAASLLKDLSDYIASSNPIGGPIPTAAILTGVNLPDHGSLFSHLKGKLKAEGVAGSVATLYSAGCTSIKHTIERMVSQFVLSGQNEENEDSSDEENGFLEIKKNQRTLPYLVEWFNSQTNEQMKTPNIRVKLVIILQDFETFANDILHDFIHILSGYRDRLPVILVFGIATSMAILSDSLSHKTLSRLSLKTFQSQPSVYFLNHTLNKVFLTPDCPFQLSRKLFQFFTNVFLFYDFSVNRFTQGLKYCVMEHFREKDAVGLLCTSDSNLEKAVQKLSHEDIEWLRRLNSFRDYVESSTDKKHQIALLTNDTYTKGEVLKIMTSLRLAVREFYAALHLLYILVSNLPQAPLGKHFRELYCDALNRDITKLPEYKECRQLLGFLAKDQLIEKLDKMLEYIKESDAKTNSLLKVVDNNLKELRDNLAKAGLTVTKSPMKSPSKYLNVQIKSRSELKQKVVQMGSAKSKTMFEEVRDSILNYIFDDLFPSKIQPFTNQTFWEVITIVETEARHRVVPRIRAPIHTALNNPTFYLLCDCCKIIDDTDILSTMPDICIVYKLHLESGPLINMYDWLQSFNIIVNPNDNQEEGNDVDPKVHPRARFTQAVAELEFLGFIKSSKKKTDHMQRLTWGGYCKP